MLNPLGGAPGYQASRRLLTIYYKPNLQTNNCHRQLRGPPSRYKRQRSKEGERGAPRAARFPSQS